ncbi:MAG: twin-arginine translocase TatA/TatE family subunit [Acidobacteria bacterium]|nr:twin-arginine translocase TatA/TatE family subunit [Acidobacteriota bacterium]
MFGTLGGPELLLILVIALIVFGPRKLPEMGRSMGKMLAEFRKASTEFRRTIEDEVESEKAREARLVPPPAALPTIASGAPPATEGGPAGPAAPRPEPAPDTTSREAAPPADTK